MYTYKYFEHPALLVKYIHKAITIKRNKIQ